MTFPERFSKLPQYPFARLRRLIDGVEPAGKPIDLSVGAPTHAFPHWISDEIEKNSDGFGKYPPTVGDVELLDAAASWLERRYSAKVDPAVNIVALNGTREGLFNACLAVCPERKNGKQSCVLIPNPFYQVYAAAAHASGAEPVYLPATEETGFLPDYEGLPESVLERTAVAYICSPSNPQGAVASFEYLSRLLELAKRHDFMIFADECYSEIYRHDPPAGMLEAASADSGIERVVAFHSLSKRSNLPGLRSGFACGGKGAIERFKWLRGYNGASLPIPLQKAAVRAWRDEGHVEMSRSLYRAKFALADEMLSGVEGYRSPKAGFFLWLKVSDGETAALSLWRDAGVLVLPGAYFGREVEGENPGKNYIRVALCPSEDRLRTGLAKIRSRLFN